jgi:uncharacterized protein YjbJ (UPF0337 family)
MAFISAERPSSSATTLVLEGGDADVRDGFELRFGHVGGHTRRLRTLEQEVLDMSIEEQAKGKLDEATGRGKQAQGDLTGDNSKKAEGVLDEAKGKAREAGDKVRDAAHDLTK